MSTWERLALSFGNSDAMVGFARYTGFRLPAGVFDRSEISQVAGFVESLGGKRYGTFAHCFCDLH